MRSLSPLNAEGMRLEKNQRLGKENWRLWGPYLAERAWGTVREDYSPDGDAWEHLRPRSGALARLSLERGRPGRHLRRAAAAVLRAGAVERPRPDPEGARIRPHRQPGQPRRGRQGVLLLPRRDALATASCAISTSIRRREYPYQLAGGRERAPQPQRPALHSARHRRVQRQPLLGRRGALRQGRRRTRSISA